MLLLSPMCNIIQKYEKKNYANRKQIFIINEMLMFIVDSGMDSSHCYQCFNLQCQVSFDLKKN
jgi:hypothetical protein